MKFICQVTLALVALMPSVSAQEDASSAHNAKLEQLSKITKGNTIELKALEIRAKIHEPQLIYVLDRAKVDVEFREEEVHFLPRIEDPITKNEF